MTYFTLHGPMRWLFIFHVIAGSLALAIFLIPLLTKKGGKLHVRTGWLYTLVMVAVGVSAFIITPWRIFWDPERTESSAGFSAFLFFISIFTLSSVWYGLVVLKNKKRTAPSQELAHLGPPFLLAFSGLGAQLLGLYLGNLTLVIFPFISHSVARDQIRYWRSSPKSKMHWWYAHMYGMFSACIATITAFLVTAIPRLWPNDFTKSPVLWVAPGLILGFILKKWTEKYRVQFGDA